MNQYLCLTRALLSSLLPLLYHHHRHHSLYHYFTTTSPSPLPPSSLSHLRLTIKFLSNMNEYLWLMLCTSIYCAVSQQCIHFAFDRMANNSRKRSIELSDVSSTSATLP